LQPDFRKPAIHFSRTTDSETANRAGIPDRPVIETQPCELIRVASPLRNQPYKSLSGTTGIRYSHA
jgi:hypothetical protein